MSMGTSVGQMGDQEDYQKYLEGTVVVNIDPDDIERIKVIIPGIYETINDCVWVGPAKQSPFGMGLGYGSFGVPQLGSTVLVELQDGDPNYPIYHGGLLKSSFKTPEQKELFHEQAWGFEDPSGNRLVVDMKAKTWFFISASKVSLFITEPGDTVINIPKEHMVTIGANSNVNIKGNTNITTGGQTNITSGAEVRVNGSVIYLNS